MMIYQWIVGLHLQGGEAIDFTWSRYKVTKKVLKIKSAELEDTGVFNCKGINGFGSDTVRIELIVVGKSRIILVEYNYIEKVLFS